MGGRLLNQLWRSRQAFLTAVLSSHIFRGGVVAELVSTASSSQLQPSDIGSRSRIPACLDNLSFWFQTLSIQSSSIQTKTTVLCILHTILSTCLTGQREARAVRQLLYLLKQATGSKRQCGPLLQEVVSICREAAWTITVFFNTSTFCDWCKQHHMCKEEINLKKIHNLPLS